MKYDEIKTKLTKIYSEGPSEASTSTSISVKVEEPTFHSSSNVEYDECIQSEEFTEYDADVPDSDQSDIETYYTNYRGFRQRNFTPANFQRRNQQPKFSNTNPTPKTEYPQRRTSDNSRKTNPPDRTGRPTRCAICQSIYHWAARCPEKKPDHSTLLVENTIVLHQSSENQSELKTLVAETWSSALLDCGASKTVCGTEWFNQYQQSLPPELKDKIETSKSTSTFRFGDGNRVAAKNTVSLPAMIGSSEVIINADVVDSDIPLLLSRDSMKRANMNLNFETDTITAFGEKIPLITTTSGHYAIPIAKPVHLANELEKGFISNITLTSAYEKSNHDIALKLHRQFAHASEHKLISLVKNAGHPWSNNKDLIHEIKKVCQDCQTCIIYKKPPARPVVALPTASRFKETVALDLKFYNKSILLHMIDHATRLSVASVVPNKKPETIVKHILQHFIQVYGKAESFLSDNGGEFINQTFLELCDTFGIKIKTTAAESPWSNGLVERHNLVLANMLDKVIDETGCSLEIALAWCLNAKNSLYNVEGFSPFQLSVGCNPVLPNILNDNLPALSNRPSSEILKDNLNALHMAREAFIQSENSEKIRRALSHPVRTSGDIKYINGDSVYYKRKDSSKWHGPATVLGQDGQQVLVKHGGVYIRVHPCRLNPIKIANSANKDTDEQPTSTAEPDNTESTQASPDYDSDDENPASPLHGTGSSNQIENANVNETPSSSEESRENSATGNDHSSSLPEPRDYDIATQDQHGGIDHQNNASLESDGSRDRAVSDLCRQLESSFHDSGSDVSAHTRNRSYVPLSYPTSSRGAGTSEAQVDEFGAFSKNLPKGAPIFSELKNLAFEQPLGIRQKCVDDVSVTSPTSQFSDLSDSLPTKPANVLDQIKPDRIIQYKNDSNDDDYITAKIVSRAGKASKSSKFPHWWNVETPTEKYSVDLKTVTDLSVATEDEVSLTTTSDELAAKMQELEEWRKRSVYTEVDDEGQNTISLRWVVKDKTTTEGKTITKARLCARGFQEEQDFRTDSPTCSREGIRIALTLIASHSWHLHSMDVKTAFLQGKDIEREVFVKPPKEANSNHIWKLNKCVYGLADASRFWYLKFREELIKLGTTPCSLDHGIFMWYRGDQLCGIAICFVDDVIWAGDEGFNQVINSLKSIFHIGSESHTSFNFIGVKLSQHHDFSIEADQNDFVESIDFIAITPSMKDNAKQPISEIQRKDLRTALGKLNWIAAMTRPEISFYTCQISTRIKNATVTDLLTTNKVIRFVKNNPGFIKFPKLDIDHLSVCAYTDASWNNLPNGGSQGGQIIFIKDPNNVVSPIIWNSNKIRRVARSTLTAESLALLDGCDSAFYHRQ